MKTPEQLNADTLFAFQMAMNGHKQFEWKSIEGNWHKTQNVSSGLHHRIFHDIPDGWTRSYGDWTGDKDAVIEKIMTCDGCISPNENQTAEWWGAKHCNNFISENHTARIYAYKLAKPAVIEKKVVPWTFETAPLCLKVQRKSDGEQFRCETYPSSALLLSKGMLKPSYETLAADYLQLDGSVCGMEESK